MVKSLQKFRKAGFTLIEMLIAITVFVIFLTVLMNSYNHILLAQKEADEFRILYSDSRRVLEDVRDEILISQIAYPKTDGSISPLFNDVQHEVLLNSGDSKISFVKGADGFGDLVLDKVVDGEVVKKKLNSHVRIKDFNVLITPSANPYSSGFVSFDEVQFQPKVTIFCRFVLDPDEYSFSDREFVLQTTVSSRFYND